MDKAFHSIPSILNNVAKTHRLNGFTFTPTITPLRNILLYVQLKGAT